VQRAPVRTVVGVQWVRGMAEPLKLWDFALLAFGTGRGRVDAAGPNLGALTLMEGTGGVDVTEGAGLLENRPGAGASLADIDGMSGVTLIEGAVTPLFSAGVSLTEMLGIGGALNLDPLLGAGESLTEIVGMSDVVIPLLSAGVSLTDMLGIGGALTLGNLLGAGDSLTDIVGRSGMTDIEGAVIPLLSAGASLTDILGTGGETPIEGTFTSELRRAGPLTEINGVSETDIVGIGGAGVVLERAGEESYTLIVGNGDAEGRVGMLAFLSELVRGRGLAGAGGSS
jgi:hypothetical protein